MDREDWNRAILGLACVALGAALGAVLSVGFELANWTEWAKAWGGLFATLLGISVASVGVLVAWANATRSARLTRKTVLELLDERLEVIAFAWNSCEAFRHGQEEDAPGTLKLNLILSANPGGLPDVQELRDGMNPIDKVKIDRLLVQLQKHSEFVREHVKPRPNWTRSGAFRAGGVYLVVKSNLEHIAMAAEDFDPGLGRHFAGISRFYKKPSSEIASMRIRTHLDLMKADAKRRGVI